ncbi:MAG: PA domain-containing protein [Acidobacteriota bacterium]
MRRRTLTRVLPALLLLALLPTAGFGAATITIVNADDPGEGFNDPTAVTPVTGNPGTTLGEQRLNLFQFAANFWGNLLNSDVEVQILSTFDPLTCGAMGATLGAAGAIWVQSDFTPLSGPPIVPLTWYAGAAANSRTGVDGDTDNEELITFYNSDIDNGCLPGVTGFYYGTDGNPEPGQIELLQVLLHEFSHGLGFANFINETTGALLLGQQDIYSFLTFDNEVNMSWADMATDAERVASAMRCGEIIWTGAKATAAAPGFLDPGVPALTVNTSPAAGSYSVGAADFGPPLSAGPVTGDIEVVDDGTAPSNTDGCEPLVGFTAGNIAFIDRGNCAFVDKVANAEAAGAVGVVVADNVAGCPAPGLGGMAASTIPAVRITLDDGNAIRAEVPGANATLGVDNTRINGLDASGQPLLYATDPIQLGSSISHWDISATPNLLMEPVAAVSGTQVDITPEGLCDVGWILDEGAGSVIAIPTMSWQGLAGLAALLGLLGVFLMRSGRMS